MGSFLASIFGGSSPTLNQDIAKSGANGSWDTGQGQGDINAGTDFLKAIISGDATKQAQVLAPQISSEKKSVQQDQATAANGATRSGGTAATTATAADKAHSDITNALASLTGTAATALPSIGTTLTAQGEQATTDQARLAQERMQNWQNSILGKGISTAVGAAEGAGLGMALPSGASTGAQATLNSAQAPINPAVLSPTEPTLDNLIPEQPMQGYFPGSI